MDQTSRPAHQYLSKQTKIEPTKKKKKNQQQQVKVVHFSNPVRFTTTAAGFRALVQELTGRDSHIADLLAGQPPATVGGGFCDSYSPLDPLASGGLDQAGIFDLPPPDLKVESGYGDGDSFEMFGERFGRVEDFGGLLMESVVFDTPVIAGDGICGWVP